MSLLRLLLKITNQKVIFPFYHAVSNNNPAHLRYLYSVRNINLFENDLLYLKRYFQPFSLDKLDKTKPGFCITFDDGLREFKDYAWPILKKHGIPAALFVNPNFVDNNGLFYRFKASILIDKLLTVNNDSTLKKISECFNILTADKDLILKAILNVNYSEKTKLDDIASILSINFNEYLKKEKPYLSKDELLELKNEGVLIGAHSMDHPLFNKLEFDQQVSQIRESVNWVKNSINPEINCFSFPFTDFGLNKRLFSKIYENKELNISYTMGTAGMKKEKFDKHLQRIPFENNLKSAHSILLREYLYYLVKAPLFKNTIRR